MEHIKTISGNALKYYNDYFTPQAVVKYAAKGFKDRKVVMVSEHHSIRLHKEFLEQQASTVD